MPNNPVGAAPAANPTPGGPSNPAPTPTVTPLTPPTGVDAQVSGSDVTVSWTDPNTAGVAGYSVSFVAKDPTAPPYPTTPLTATKSPLTVTPGAKDPTAATLVSDYVATVVVNPKDAKTHSPSDPGSQAYWAVNGSITITMGTKSLTLTMPPKSSGGGGVYRLPVSKDKPYTITADEINSLIGTDIVPDQLFGSGPNSGLNISDLAVDIDNKLFKIGIGVTPNQPLFPGLTINSLTLDVERKDGVHHTLDDAAAPAS